MASLTAALASRAAVVVLLFAASAVVVSACGRSEGDGGSGEEQSAFHPSWSPDGTKIVFALERGRGREVSIHVLDLKSGRVEQLTDSSDRSFDPAWSPTGTYIAFHRANLEQQPPVADLYIISPAGGEARRIAEEARDAAWSPDGRSLVYWVEEYGGPDTLRVVTVTGKVIRQIRIREGFHLRFPFWSPDGRRIAFTANGGRGFTYVVDAAGDQAHVLAPPPLAGGAWSPDWSKVAYIDHRTNELYVAQFPSGERRRLSLTRELEAWPAWSSDQKRLAFTRADARGANGKLYVIDLDGQGLRRVFG